MPEVSRFFGVSTRMYFDDHNPPHFHAIYGEAEAELGIEPIVGGCPMMYCEPVDFGHKCMKWILGLQNRVPA